MIGALGALDDVTVTQVAAVAEVHHRNRDLSVAELITSGIRVGREHIASTVNTLLLAYAGASMPLLLVFAASDQPLGAVANSEIVAVEIVRTLCGSIGLVAAVPVTTVMAALLVGTLPDDEDGADGDDGLDEERGWDDDGPDPIERVEPIRPAGAVGPTPAPNPASNPAPAPAPDERPRPKASWDDFAPVDEEF